MIGDLLRSMYACDRVMFRILGFRIYYSVSQDIVGALPIFYSPSNWILEDIHDLLNIQSLFNLDGTYMHTALEFAYD